jgi:hypothetical protein
MRRALDRDLVLVFECWRHKVPLVNVDGPPYLVPTTGGWRFDLADMDCPESMQDSMEPSACFKTWRVWVVEK